MNIKITQKLDIMLVENNAAERMMMSKLMNSACNSLQIKFAENMKDALTLSSIHSFDFILIASTIADNANSIGLIGLCKLSAGKPEVIMLMPDDRPQQLFEAQKIGISDYLSKKDITGSAIAKCFSLLIRQRNANASTLSAEKRLLEIEGRLKTIVRQLNELVTVEKEKEKDIKPEYQLTETKVEPSNINPTALKAEHDFSHIHMLIAEDNDINRFIIEKMIKKLGVQMTFAANGMDTIRMFTASKFDMVLMDIEMPGMNGHETASSIRNELKNASVPIIAMSAHSSLDEKEKCIRSGMNDYIYKPFEEATLHQMIAKWNPIPQSIGNNI